MTRNYDELLGSSSGDFHFERRRVGAFLSADATPRLRVAGVEFAVFDMGARGLSVGAPVLPGTPSQTDSLMRVGAELECEVLVHGREVFSGVARVSQVEQRASGPRFDLRVTRGFLDMDAAALFDAESALDRELKQGPGRSHLPLPRDFRDAIFDASLFISHYQRVLNKHAANRPAPDLEGARRNADLCESMIRTLRAPWRDICARASSAAAPLFDDPTQLAAAKALTESAITPYLLESPMIDRAYRKPLGYPGDYQVMLHYYNNRFEGQTTHARVFHKLFVEHPLSQGVCTRNDFVVAHILEEHRRNIAEKDTLSEFNGLSLGCGPAMEARDSLLAQGAWPGRVTWTLVDQEPAALAIAHENFHLALAKCSGEGALRGRNLGFSQLLRDPSLLGEVPPQSFICSSGLFDYLRPKRAQVVTSWLYSLLAPGGTMMIGNAKGPNEHFWSAEMVLDWPLIYRTKAEVLAFASKLPSCASSTVVLEPGGAYYFLVVRKAASAAADPHR